MQRTTTSERVGEVSRITDKDIGQVHRAGVLLLMAARCRAKEKSTLIKEVMTASGICYEDANEAFRNCVKERWLVPVPGSDGTTYWESV